MADFDPTDYGDGGDGGHGRGGGGIADDFLAMEQEEAPADANGAPADKPTLRDAILFVIDFSHEGALAPMTPGGRSAVGEALSAAVSVLKTKVITSPDDRIGVVYYGVREKLNPNGFEGIRLVQELDRPSAHRIRELENELSRSSAQFEERYGCQKPVPLSDVFWTCTTIFNLSANPKQFQPRLFLFTGNDNPCSCLAEQEAAVTRANDLLDLGVDFEFFPVVPPSTPFGINNFWGRVLTVDTEDFLDQATLRIEELERRVRRRLHRKRVLQRLSFEMCPGVEMAVSVFVHIFPATVPAPIYLLNESNKPLQSKTRYICERTAGILLPADDIETFIEVGGERVYVSRKEMDEVKCFGAPGLKLLGFKPANKLKNNHRIFHSYFVYPNERAVQGSAALCASLIDSMVEKKLMAIARYIPRRSSQPVLVALLPQAEKRDSEGADQERPPGFNMILLPWAEDIRHLHFPAATEAAPMNPALLGAARQVVQAMRLDNFTPGCVENPVLQRHYAAVQALALGEDKPEETPDLLQPDLAALNEKSALLHAWRDQIDAAVPAPAHGAAAGRKRPAPSGEAGGGFYDDGLAPPPRAAPRREHPAVPATMEAMRELVLSGEVDRLTMPVLKDWLKSQGVTCGGKKADLVARIQAIV